MLHDSHVKTRAMIDEFLSALDGFIRTRNAAELSDYIVIEPDRQGNFGQAYSALIQYVRGNFPANSDAALESFCSQRLPTARAGGDDAPWNDFVRFTVAYLRFLTLVNPQDLLHTYNQLSDLVQYAAPSVRSSASVNGLAGDAMLP